MSDEVRKPPPSDWGTPDDDDRFLAVIGHELRTPLGAMLTIVELLDRTDLTDTQRGYLDTLRQAGESGLQLTELLLALHAGDEGGIGEWTAPSRFQPLTLLQSVIDLFLPAAQAKNLSLTLTENSDSERSMIGRPALLRQCVTALIDNAIKYSGDGAIALTAGLEAAGAALVISVSDCGPGIGEAERDRIFQAFARGDAKDRVASGYGLGLWITARIAELAGAALELDAQAETGARFVLRFPVEIDDEDASRQAGGQGERPDAPKDLAGRHVLVVDDNAISRQLIAACLDGFGVRSTLVGGGRNAFEAVKSTRFDAVLIDLLMPEMGGDLVASRIAEMTTGQHLPLIGLSASAGAFAASRNPAGAFRAVVAKPFTPETLFRALSEAISE